jgi:hypothetical protein
MSELKVAEERMQSIEERLAAVEALNTTSTSAADSQALLQYQKQILAKLTAVRDQMKMEGGDITTIKRERDEAVAQNAIYKKEIDKLNYRVNHLIKALNAEEAKNQT